MKMSWQTEPLRVGSGAMQVHCKCFFQVLMLGIVS